MCKEESDQTNNVVLIMPVSVRYFEPKKSTLCTNFITLGRIIRIICTKMKIMVSYISRSGVMEIRIIDNVFLVVGSAGGSNFKFVAAYF